PQATKIILNDTSINKEKKLNNLLIIVKRQLGIDEKLNSIQSLKIIIEKLEMRHYNPVESLQCVK
nr:hypothetical protein [Endozoicomonas sp.]